MELNNINTWLRIVLVSYSIFFSYRYIKGWGFNTKYWGDKKPLFNVPGWIKPKLASKGQKQQLFWTTVLLWLGVGLSLFFPI